jgi:hypothetical protein
VSNGSDILDEIKDLAARDRISIRFHARQRMGERGATYEDVKRALVTARRAVWQDDHGTWRVVGGVDLDGDELQVAVDVQADVIVVTVF